MSEYRRLDGESNLELIYRICSDKELIGTWQDVADILNKILGEDYSESKYRKDYQAFNRIMGANKSKFSDESSRIEEIREAERRLEREKIRFRDERNAWQKQNYVAARVEDKMDKLEEALRSSGRIQFPSDQIISVEPTGRELLLLLSDLHIGENFNNYWGSYNTQIAKDRMGQLLARVRSIMAVEECSGCNVVLLGDCISGSIHRSIQVTNRENVIDQIKIATELVSSFIYELTQSCRYVEFTSVSGNHSRIDKKEDAIHSERLDDLVEWGVVNKLSHIENFFYTGQKIDTSIAVIHILGKEYVAVHGDYDSFAKSGVQNLCTMLKIVPEAVLFGHMHTCAFNDVNGIKMVRGGSLSGSGDDYTIEKRLSGSPSQMVCICDDTGIISYHPIVLK